MNERLASILTGMGVPLERGPTEATVDLGDGRRVERRADGRAYVTMPAMDRAAMFGPMHNAAPKLAPATMRNLNCSERSGWLPGKLVMVAGRHADATGAALGMLSAGWGPRHAPVRYVAADSAPHDWTDHERKPCHWNTPNCATLIIGKVWPSLSAAQVHFVLRACQDRRSKSVIVCAEAPDPMPASWAALVDYCARDGSVVRV